MISYDTETLILLVLCLCTCVTEDTKKFQEYRQGLPRIHFSMF